MVYPSLFEALLNFASNDAATRSENLRAESFADGKDLYGFGALPAGYYVSGAYSNFGARTHFWSATEANNLNAATLFLDVSEAKRMFALKTFELSVRCLKD